MANTLLTSPRRSRLQHQIAADEHTHAGAGADSNGRLHIELMLDQFVARPLDGLSGAVADGECDVVVVTATCGNTSPNA